MHRFSLAIIILASMAVAGVESHHRRDVDVCDLLNNDAADDACGMKQAFAGSSVYPQIVASFSPKAALYVQYRNVIVGGAQQLAPGRVSAKPTLSMDFLQGVRTAAGAQLAAKKYAVMCVDYQAKGQVSRIVWLQSGMAVDRTSGLLGSSIQPIFPYRAPNPSPGSGTHEYVFLAIEDNGAGMVGLLNRQPKLKASLAGAFNLKSFLAQANLANLVVAGSFFKSSR